MGKPRILLADDQESILEETQVTLGDEFEVVGVVRNGQDAIAAVRRDDPDVLVIDISMPIVSGIQAVAALRSTNPRTKVAFLTVHNDQDFIDAAFSVGACAYVVKSDLTRDLVPAIHEVLRGRIYVSPSLSHMLGRN